MKEFLLLGLSFGAGAVLGWLYFVSLWKTLRQLPFFIQKGMFMWGSLVLRMIGVLGGFYIIMIIGNGRSHALVGLLGFLSMRSVLIRRWGLSSASYSLRH